MNPALHTNCQVLRDRLPGVVDETLSELQSRTGPFCLCALTGLCWHRIELYLTLGGLSLNRACD